ncbi:MAG: hypothetical protein ACRC8A_04130 [Microcoleaceae cyanobacterium]
MEANLVSEETICQAFEITPRTLAGYRKQYFILGVHFVQPTQKLIRYNLELIKHWFLTRHDPVLHEAMCHQHLESLKPTRKSMPSKRVQARKRRL